MRIITLLGFLALLLMASSGCVSNKKYILLQNAPESVDSTFFYNPPRQEYRIQPNDILYVNIRSQDELATILFNPSSSSGNVAMSQNLQNGRGNTGNAFYVTGYSLDQEGRIKLPMIGYLKVLGLTVKEVKVLVEKEVERYFNKFFVVVRLSGINYTIMGEVEGPGQAVVFQNQVNILEAIAQAGGLRELANRNEVSLIRQYPEGYKLHKIDLTNVSVFDSKYYYLQPNDLIYIPPLKIRVLGKSSTGVEAFRDIVSIIGGIAAVSANVVLILNLNKE